MAKTLKLGSWFARFIAWLIDVIIVQTITGIILISGQTQWWLDLSGLGIQSIIFLAYWTFLEGYYGKSVGKIVLKLKTTDEEGRGIDYGKALINSIGKVYLLPLDVIIGLIAFNDKRQRLFQKLSGIIVIKTEVIKKKNVKYEK